MLAQPKPKPIRLYRRYQETRNAWLFLTPAAVVLLTFWVLPLALGFIFSLYHWNFGASPLWAGFHEYSLVLHSSLFWQSLRNTLLFALGVVGVGTGLSLLLALALYSPIKGRGVLRTLLFMPYVMPLMASSTIWLWMYQPTVGLFDQVLHAMGLPGSIGWVQNPQWALPALILFTIWYSLGFTTLLFLAGLTNISPTLYEAARIDGATRWTEFSRITLPLLSPTTLFVVVVNTISVFQSFTQIFALTRGGPLGATTTLTYLVYEDSFQYFHFGTGLAVGVLLFVVVAILTALQIVGSRRLVTYGE